MCIVKATHLGYRQRSFAETHSCETGCRKMPFERLEPCAPKGACTVPRGLGAGNRVWLPDSEQRVQICQNRTLEPNVTLAHDALDHWR